MHRQVLVALAGFAVAACGSPARESAEGPAPDARPIAFEQNQAAKNAVPAPAADPKSGSRVLGYVEGDVITYREIVQLVGAELSQIESQDERAAIEERALLEVVRARMMYRAALDAGVKASRDEIDAEREAKVRDLAKSGGTLDAYLHEHDMTRREFDEKIKRDLITSKYQFACVGRGNSPDVHVRPLTDTWVTPEDVQKYYDRNPEKFHEPELARFRMLTVRTDLGAPKREAAVAAARTKAQSALARLKAGEDWSPVYRQANQGVADADPFDGLGEIARGGGKVADWIEEFAFKAGKGELLLKEMGTTFYILRGEGAHPERTIPFSEAEPDIRARLFQARAKLAWLEVELTVLDQSSIQPESLRQRLREFLRGSRLKVMEQTGL